MGLSGSSSGVGVEGLGLRVKGLGYRNTQIVCSVQGKGWV